MGITGNAKTKAQADLDMLKKDWAAKQKQVGDYVPQVTDKATYDQLVAAVNAAAAKNESIAALQARVIALGEAATRLAKTIGLI